MDNYPCLPQPFSNLREDEIYQYFLDNMLIYDLRYEGNAIRFFDTPVIDGRLQGFHHISTRKPKNTKFELSIRMLEDRARYINWIIPIIENAKACHSCENRHSCSKIKFWRKKQGAKNKIYFMVRNDVDYIIIAEQKKGNLYYISTAFIVDEPYYLKSFLDDYHRYIEQRRSRQDLVVNQ